MRRNYLKSGILFIGCLVFLFSCQKQNTNPPEIEFLSPLHSQNLVLGDTFGVDVDVWDDQEVVSYEITLESESGFEYFNDKQSIHRAFYHISYDFDVSTATDQNFDITMKIKDNEGNETKRSILVSINK
ncbi:MAG: hypothetical protein ACJATI_000256 [Halioglobus sp.]|jgi:hypothetical protein